MNRWRTVGHVAAVLLAGGLLVLAWWDWTYPGLLPALWRGEFTPGYAWRELIWSLAVGEVVGLGVWWVSAASHPGPSLPRVPSTLYPIAPQSKSPSQPAGPKRTQPLAVLLPSPHFSCRRSYSSLRCLITISCRPLHAYSPNLPPFALSH